MLQPAARQQHAALDQRLDHGLVGVALFALVVDDALAGEARRVIGEGAVLIDGVGDGGVDAARRQLARIRRPDLEILAAMAGRGVHEAGAGVVGDVIAGAAAARRIRSRRRVPFSGWAHSTASSVSAGRSRTFS